MQRKSFFPAWTPEVNSLLMQGDERNNELSAHLGPHLEKSKFNPGLNQGQKEKIQALSECHQKGLQFEKTQGLCFLNIDQFGLFACADIKEEKEKQFLECQNLFKRL